MFEMHKLEDEWKNLCNVKLNQLKQDCEKIMENVLSSNSSERKRKCEMEQQLSDTKKVKLNEEMKFNPKKMLVKELKVHLKERGLSQSGLKAVLIKRLEKALKEEMALLEKPVDIQESMVSVQESTQETPEISNPVEAVKEKTESPVKRKTRSAVRQSQRNRIASSKMEKKIQKEESLDIHAVSSIKKESLNVLHVDDQRGEKDAREGRISDNHTDDQKLGEDDQQQNEDDQQENEDKDDQQQNENKDDQKQEEDKDDQVKTDEAEKVISDNNSSTDSDNKLESTAESNVNQKDEVDAVGNVEDSVMNNKLSSTAQDKVQNMEKQIQEWSSPNVSPVKQVVVEKEELHRPKSNEFLPIQEAKKEVRNGSLDLSKDKKLRQADIKGKIQKGRELRERSLMRKEENRQRTMELALKKQHEQKMKIQKNVVQQRRLQLQAKKEAAERELMLQEDQNVLAIVERVYEAAQTPQDVLREANQLREIAKLEAQKKYQVQKGLSKLKGNSKLVKDVSVKEKEKSVANGKPNNLMKGLFSFKTLVEKNVVETKKTVVPPKQLASLKLAEKSRQAEIKREQERVKRKELMIQRQKDAKLNAAKAKQPPVRTVKAPVVNKVRFMNETIRVLKRFHVLRLAQTDRKQRKSKNCIARQS